MGCGRAAGSNSDPWTVEVEIRASAGTFAQLFWGSELHFVEERSTRVPIDPRVTGFQRVRFMVPSGIAWVRLDPSDAPGEVLIGRIEVLDGQRRVLATMTAAIPAQTHQIASVTPEEGSIRLVTAPGANDPWMVYSIGCVPGTSAWRRLTLVGPVSLILVGAAVIALLAACAAAVVLPLFGRGGNPGEDLSSRASPVHWLWLAVVFLAVLSAKLLLMREYPLRVPFWDQWDGEAYAVFVPYAECSLSWEQMFGLHNEHRIFFTRLFALGLMLLNAQWDPRFQQVVNAALHALTAVLLVVMLWRAFGLRRLDLLVLLGILAFGLPFGWENTLLGFQSAFYFLVLFSLLALWLTAAHDVGTIPWYLGWLSALCALFSAAGGIVVPLVIALVAALELANDPRRWRGALVTFFAAGCVLAAGVLAASPPLDYHEAYRAKTVKVFAAAWGRSLAWPWVQHPAAAAAMWLPAGLLLVLVALRRGRTTLLERVLIGLAAWVAVQSAAIAYGRGAAVSVPASRYQDFLSLGFVANTMALLSLSVTRTRHDWAVRHLWTIILAGWLAAAAFAIDRLSMGALADLPTWRQHWSVQAANVRRFVLTNDAATLLAQRPPDVPYPDSRRLALVLQQPAVRRILPAAVRTPLRIEPETITNGAFVPEGTYPTTPRDPILRAWGSYTPRANAARGRFQSVRIPGCQLGGSLQFAVAGYLGLPHQYLGVRSLDTGRTAEIGIARLPREDWLNAAARCPQGPFSVIAEDRGPEHWFAFREPVEVGRLSSIAEAVIAISPRLLLLSLAMAILALKHTRASAPN